MKHWKHVQSAENVLKHRNNLDLEFASVSHDLATNAFPQLMGGLWDKAWISKLLIIQLFVATDGYYPYMLFL